MEYRGTRGSQEAFVTKDSPRKIVERSRRDLDSQTRLQMAKAATTESVWPQKPELYHKAGLSKYSQPIQPFLVKRTRAAAMAKSAKIEGSLIAISSPDCSHHQTSFEGKTGRLIFSQLIRRLAKLLN